MKRERISERFGTWREKEARTCDVISFKTDVLLLDEPTAGISVEEVPAILQVIENIKKHPESTIVLIEHKMDMILGLSIILSFYFMESYWLKDCQKKL